MASKIDKVTNEAKVYQKLREYEWDKDREFQDGLSAILGSETVSTRVQDLTLRAQCFYFTRKTSIPVSFDQYKSYLLEEGDLSDTVPSSTANNNPKLQPADSLCLSSIDAENSDGLVPTNLPTQHHSDLSHERASMESAPYPSTFEEIIALIMSGASIPGIRDIPSTVVPEQASLSTIPKRMKPWQKKMSTELTTGGTFGDRRNEIITQEYPDGDEVFK
ncbi:Bgt-4540 [Blumeria graminis f. sp. tritici]|uniref:Bgt-4540 n=2 Tax=Blumeria graminis f. sp. tritici TaxID=62690 RepID=A0A061HKT4_BLUGR|nr:hypothetical protein BGT96224_4540 [Blumeria graminis f. sp. tritici 96224]VDB93888.1 Bgt-4540 [Blumeria graminis f. sp. tritici]